MFEHHRVSRTVLFEREAIDRALAARHAQVGDVPLDDVLLRTGSGDRIASRVDDVFFAACEHDTELYVVGARYARARRDPNGRAQCDWRQLGSKAKFLQVLANGQIIRPRGLFRSLSQQYDISDALLGVSSVLSSRQALRRRGQNLNPGISPLGGADVFGFRPTVIGMKLSGARARPHRPEAAQIFLLQVGPEHALHAEFPGQLVLGICRRCVDPALGIPETAVHLGHELDAADAFLTITYTAAPIEPQVRRDFPDQSMLPLHNRFMDTLSRWARGLPERLDSAHEEMTETGVLHHDANYYRQNLSDPYQPLAADGECQEDQQRQRQRHAQVYLEYLAAPRLVVEISLATVATVSIIHERSVGRGILALELICPPRLYSSSGHAISEMEDRLSAALSQFPRLYVYGDFSELYRALRRICYVHPGLEGVIYRTGLEQVRDLHYSPWYPAAQWDAAHAVEREALARVLMGTLRREEARDVAGEGSCGTGGSCVLASWSPADLWHLAELCRIRHLLPVDADVFALSEHLLLYTVDRRREEDAYLLMKSKEDASGIPDLARDDSNDDDDDDDEKTLVPSDEDEEAYRRDPDMSTSCSRMRESRIASLFSLAPRGDLFSGQRAWTVVFCVVFLLTAAISSLLFK